MFRSRTITVAFAAVLLALAASVADAQRYPSKPIRLIVPWPAAGNADAAARLVGTRLGQVLGESVVIENRAGAGGNIGMEMAAKAPADGYTLVLVVSANAINVNLSNVPFDLKRDFAPIGVAAGLPLVLIVHPSLPVTSVAQLIDHARANPGKLNYASGGNGTGSHLAAELFKLSAKLDMRHVPYKGAAPAMTDLIGGQVDFTFDGMASALPQVKAGKVRPLAVTTAKRSVALPDVPTMSEAGLPGFEVNLWIGFMAPAATDPKILATLAAALSEVLNASDVQERLVGLGLEPMRSTPAEFGATVETDIVKWAKVVKESGAKID